MYILLLLLLTSSSWLFSVNKLAKYLKIENDDTFVYIVLGLLLAPFCGLFGFMITFAVHDFSL